MTLSHQEVTKHLEVLFVGLGNSRVAWYRCVLPAMYLGLDWMGVVGQPPHTTVATSYVKGQTAAARLEDYDVLILQQPRGREWFTIINNLRSAGKVVLYEIDDYVHGIRKSKDHDFKQYFDRDSLKRMELCMRACNGMIASTDYIARRYSQYVPRTWVCENGLDMGRYRLDPPRRGDVGENESVTVMWSGATGHRIGTAEWLNMLMRVMDRYPHVCFASIGQDFGGAFRERYGERAVSVPFAALETYPSAMMLGDIALAPAGTSAWYRGKSDLRAMEAAALGLPVVAHQHYRNAVVQGETGFVAESADAAEQFLCQLVEDTTLRKTMGAAARKHADDTFDMRHRRESWREMIIDAWETCHGA